MFTRVELHNFRSCRRVVLDGLGSLTALVGRNGAGKSNVLIGLQSAATTATGTTVPAVHGMTGLEGRSAVVFEMRLDHVTYRYTFGREWRPFGPPQTAVIGTRPVVVEQLDATGSNGPVSVMLSRDDAEIWLGSKGDGSPIRVGERVPALRALASLLPSTSPHLAVVTRVLSFLGGVRYYPAETLAAGSEASVVPRDQYESWLSQYLSTGDPGESVTLRLIYMSVERPDLFAQVQETIRDKLGVLDQISVARITSGPPGDRPEAGESGRPHYYSLGFSPGSGSDLFDYAGLSFGTRRLLRMVVSLVLDGSSVLLIEQPEDGVHAGLTRKLVSMFRSFAGPTQVFLATHSADILNDVAPQEVRLVTMSSGRTDVRPLDDRERDAARSYLLDEGTLADFVQLVEGE